MRDIFHSLLIDATDKMIELRNNHIWAAQLPVRCPPVLWFGNADSSKPRVLTFAANPSAKEFLTTRNPLTYLKKPRLHVLAEKEHLADIRKSKVAREKIITGYNDYFTKGHNPFNQWFGHDRDDSFKIEGFLRGYGASYFGGDEYHSAIHIDLFPFATLENFGKIKELPTVDLFRNRWTQDIIERLVKALSPSVLIVFGVTNCHYFGEHVDQELEQDWQLYDGIDAKIKPNTRYFISRSSKLSGLQVIGLNTYLGNPRGFGARSLREYGKFIRERSQQPT
jgi:hypothetical protein